MRILASILSTVLILLTSSCTQNLTGGSSDHGNASTVISIIDENSNSIKNGTIKVISSNYDPFNNIENEYFELFNFDSSGIILIDNLPIDSYTIIAFNDDSILSNISNINIEENDSITITLTESGIITIPVDSSILNPNCQYYIEELKLALDSIYKGFWINEFKVPQGDYTIKKSNQNKEDSTIFNNITVESGYLTDISFYPETPNGSDTIYADSHYNYYSYFDYEELKPHIYIQLLEYQFDWGDGTQSQWQHKMDARHEWDKPGTYEIRVHLRYRDAIFTDPPETFISYWSKPFTVVVLPEPD